MPRTYPDLDTIIKETRDISPAPQILPKLRRILDDANSDLNDAVALIKMDIALSGQILKYANSSLFGGSMPVDTLEHAIQRFGFRQVQKMVLVASAKSALSRDLAHFETAGHSLFEISLSCADIMASLASNEHFEEEEDVAYTIGLFHGVGKIVVDSYFSKSDILFYENNDESITLEEERKLLGFDHAQAGGALLQSWRFSDVIVNPIRDQFTPPAKLTSHCDSTIALTLASFTALKLLLDPFEPETVIQSFQKQYPDYWGVSGYSEERTAGTLLQARDSYLKNIEMTH